MIVGYGGVVGWFGLTRVLCGRRCVFVYVVQCEVCAAFFAPLRCNRRAQAAWFRVVSVLTERGCGGMVWLLQAFVYGADLGEGACGVVQVG